MNEQPRSAPPDSPGTDPAALERKRRLLGIRSEMGVAPGAGGEAGQSEAAAPAVARGEGGELNDFIKGLQDKKRQRKHQLGIIQDFFQNPVEFGVDMDVVPSGTSLEEIRARQKELGYRIDLLKSVLQALETELEMFKHAERSAPGFVAEEVAAHAPAQGADPDAHLPSTGAKP